MIIDAFMLYSHICRWFCLCKCWQIFHTWSIWECSKEVEQLLIRLLSDYQMSSFFYSLRRNFGFTIGWSMNFHQYRRFYAVISPGFSGSGSCRDITGMMVYVWWMVPKRLNDWIWYDGIRVSLLNMNSWFQNQSLMGTSPYLSMLTSWINTHNNYTVHFP